MLGWSGDTNCPGDMRPPQRGPSRGWGQVIVPQRAAMGRPPCPPSTSQPWVSLLPLQPLPFLTPFSPQSPLPSVQPQFPRGRGLGSLAPAGKLPGGVTHLPALPAGLPEGARAASVSLRVKRKMVSIPGQSSGVKAAS